MAGPRVSPESFDQRQITIWRNLYAREITELRWLIHVPNGGQRPGRAASFMKAEGQVAGWPDWTWPLAMGDSRGIAVELKRIDGGQGLDADQLSALRFLREQGWVVLCCHGWHQAVRAIASYYRGWLAFDPDIGVQMRLADGSQVAAQIGALPAATTRAALARAPDIVPVTHWSLDPTNHV